MVIDRLVVVNTAQLLLDWVRSLTNRVVLLR